MKIGTALAEARGRVPPAESRLLLRHVLGVSAAWLEAHRDDELDPAQAQAFAALVARCAAGEPVAYLLGYREFYGREFAVTPAVLVPRPETELLVDLALAQARALPRPRLLDLGAGSGCVAITLALELPVAQVTAVDLSAAALAVARANAERLGAAVGFIESDWFAALGEVRFDVVVGNPPYVAAGDPHLQDLRFEPEGALVSGADGLDAIRIIVHEAPKHLAPGGWLFLEHGYDQAAAVARLLAANGFVEVDSHADLAGIHRVSCGRLA